MREVACAQAIGLSGGGSSASRSLQRALGEILRSDQEKLPAASTCVSIGPALTHCTSLACELHRIGARQNEVSRVLVVLLVALFAANPTAPSLCLAWCDHGRGPLATACHDVAPAAASLSAPDRISCDMGVDAAVMAATEESKRDFPTSGRDLADVIPQVHLPHDLASASLAHAPGPAWPQAVRTPIPALRL
jgi:hypothetical protein